MYWYIQGINSRMLVIPFAATGETVSFSAQLVIEDGEIFEKAFLCLLSKRFGNAVQIQVDSSGVWMDVAPALEPSAWLGTLTGPRELHCDFQVTFPTSMESGEYAIPVGFFHGGEVPEASSLFTGADFEGAPLWGDKEADAPLWNWLEGPAPYWEEGSICGRKAYMYLPPGETLNKWDCVRVATDGDEAAYLAADCVASGQTAETLTVEKTWMRAHANAGLAEANCLGIIDDDCVNYEHALDGVVLSDGTSLYWQGGVVDSVITGRVWQLNRLTRLWTELDNSVDGARSQHVGFYYGGALHIWGGKDGSGTFLNSLLKFDLTTKAWSTLSTGGTARCQAACMVIGSKVHFIGGVNESGAVVQTVDIFDLETPGWSTGTAAPSVFTSLGIEAATPIRPVWQVCDGILFYGSASAGRDEQFFQYNGSTWTSPTPLADRVAPGRGILPNVPLQFPNSLPQHAARIQPNGEYGLAEWVALPTTDSRLADVWNEDLGSYGTINVGERRALLQGFCTDVSWDFSEGQQGYLGASDGEFVTTRPAAGWIQVLWEQTSAHTICWRPQAPFYQIVRWANSAWAYDGVRYAYEFGGDDGTGVTNRLRRLDYTTMQWEELTAGCTARSHAGMAFSANKLYVVGGIDTDGVTLLNTTCIYDVFTDTWTAAEEEPYAAGYDWTVVEGAWPDGTFWDGEWDLDFCYKENAITFHGGTLYRSKQTHLSAATNEPSTGEDWEDYWEVWTELPPIYVIGGTTQGGLEGDVWVYDPNTDTWNEGIGAGSDFQDNFNTNAIDFAAAQEELIGSATLEDSWPCQWADCISAGLGSVIYTIGARYWSVGGEMIFFQRTLIAYSLSGNVYSESYDLSGDYVLSQNNPESLASLEHMYGYDRYLYAFGQYYDPGPEDYRFGAFRINPETMACDLIAACRTGGQIEPGVNDRAGCSGTFSDGKVYFYGGHGPLAPQVDVFDLETESFDTSIASGGVERVHHAATVHQNKLYVYFGNDEEGVYLPSAIKLNLITSEVTEWVVPEEYWGGGNDGNSACTDDDGNLFVRGYVMFMPSTDTWVENTEMIFDGDQLIYYGGALYWDVCDGADISKYKADLGAGYVPLPITKTVTRNRDGSITVTYSTGETYTTFVTFTGSSSGGGATQEVWTDTWSVGNGMSSLGGDAATGDSVTVRTGYSTDDGGQQSVERSYTVTKTKSGGQRVTVQTNYAS